MSVAITIRNVSKRYRIGLAEERSETFAGQIMDMVKAPLRNLKQLRSLSRFKEEDESVFWALRDISFDVQQGEVLGIIGHNGAGKSTLLKILSRITEPTSGEITINGRVGSLLEVGTGFHPDLTGRENIYMNGTILGMKKREIDHKLDEIITFSGVSKYIDTPVKRYSSGMKVRLAFSVAAHLEPEILIVDEVLAVGDIEFQKKCIGKMNEVTAQGRTVLFVSHSMPIIKSLCNRASFLNRGTIDYIGGVGEAIERYLKKETDIEIDEIVPEGVSTYNSGEGKITKVRMLNSQQSKTNELQYLEPFSIQLELEMDKSIDYPIVDVRFYREGVELGHCANTYNNEVLSLAAGANAIEVEIQNRLQPGFYSLALGIHKSDGYTIDYLENVFELNVLPFSNLSPEQYPFKLNIGMVKLDSTWRKTN